MRLPINFHHLHYFWAVAHEGNLTRVARTLRVAPSAVSAQIRQLEDTLGAPLFVREGRRLVLTEAGTIARDYADDILRSGTELAATLREGRGASQTLRIGAVATLSRNFQRSFVRPLFARDDVHLSLVSGGLTELVQRLVAHELDLVLTNRPPRAQHGLRCQPLARQPVSLVSSRPPARFRFPHDLAAHPLVLPGPESEVRSEFDALCAKLDVRVRVRAEVDDMATLRLVARDSGALALVPTVVVRDELREGRIREVCRVPDLAESFYAVTMARKFQHPLVRVLLMREESELLAMRDVPARGAPRRKKTPRKKS
jgi:LysR family transcriptional activator of nhaA